MEIKEKDFSEINEEGTERVYNAVKTLFLEAQESVLSSSPMFIRFNLITNILTKAIKEGKEEKDILWDKVNYYLKDNVDEFDFKFVWEIQSLEELQILRDRCFDAPLLGTVWQEKFCRDCGEKFSIPYGEILFFEKKGFKVPKRCPECRKKSHRQKPSF